MLNERLKQFKSPGPDFRGAPFWAWNAKLEPEELIRQIHLMKEMGFGGFIMHARVGLDTEYLGREWFDCVKTCVAEAEKLGMKAWLYDEDRWPSGSAGGLATREDRFKQKMLYPELLDRMEQSGNEGNTLAWYAVRFDGAVLISFRRLENPAETALTRGEKLLRCYWCCEEKDSWFNGETYLDTLNEDAVKRFVELTHEAYRREIGSQFGKTVPGIWSDEECYNRYFISGGREMNLPWTVSLPEKFREKYGYDLLDFLPELFFEGTQELSRARWNYYDLLTTLFVNAFSRTIGEWCERNHMQMTGHVLEEDTLSRQTWLIGSAMRFYEFMQTPGIDLLTEHWNVFNTAKQCVSVARQLGRKNRFTETYGVTGWDFPFFGHKALGDWQLALGINLRSPHLAWYSMSAEAKRDYPASIFYQSPWFRRYDRVEEYFSRIGSILSEGEEIRDILMIHPIESCWSIRYAGKFTPEIQKLDTEFIDVTNRLLAENLDFDYGDEELLSRYAEMEGKTFKVGKARYKAVLIPALKTIRATTLKLLDAFADQGGTVCYLGPAPEYVDAVRSDEAQKTFSKFRLVTRENDTAELSKTARRVSLTGADGTQVKPLLYHLAETEDAISLFLCNVGIEFSSRNREECLVRDRKLAFPFVEVALELPERGQVYELDPVNGTIHAVDANYENGKYRFHTFFEELGSRLFLITKEAVGEVLPAKQYPAGRILKQLPATGWEVRREESNVLVLDHAACFVDGKKRSDRCYILKIDDELRKMLGKPPRGATMVQPWCREKKRPEKTLDVRLEYEIECESVPSGECRLAVEHPELYRIKVNGVELNHAPVGWWMDIVLRCLPIPAGTLKKGKNTLTFTMDYHENLPGLEAVFLLGEFGVRGEKLTSAPQTLSCGDWCEQGFPYYAGNLTYETVLADLPSEGRIFVHIPEWRGAALGVSVNGGAEIFLPWPPYQADVTDQLRRDGTDRVAIKVYGHRRNALGPFYIKEKWPDWTRPELFKRYDVTERQLVPCGLLDSPLLETEQ